MLKTCNVPLIKMLCTFYLKDLHTRRKAKHIFMNMYVSIVINDNSIMMNCRYRVMVLISVFGLTYNMVNDDLM